MPLPQTEAPGRLQAELMSRGLRMTHQRRTILSVVETAKQHLDASQILRRARKLDPQVDRVTAARRACYGHWRWVKPPHPDLRRRLRITGTGHRSKPVRRLKVFGIRPGWVSSCAAEAQKSV